MISSVSIFPSINYDYLKVLHQVIHLSVNHVYYITCCFHHIQIFFLGLELIFFNLILLLFQISKVVLLNYILIFFYNAMYSRTLFSSIGYGFLPYRIHNIFMPNDSLLFFVQLSWHFLIFVSHLNSQTCCIHYSVSPYSLTGLLFNILCTIASIYLSLLQ